MKNIAICLSGQPRNWKNCYQSWLDALSNVNCNKHFFIHFWNYNSLPRQLIQKMSATEELERLSDSDLKNIVSTLKPKLFKFDSGYIEPDNLYNHDQSNQLLRWSLSQFYSLQQSSMLKRQYELSHDMQYDAVIKIRSDLQINSKINIEFPLAPNSMYSMYSTFLPEHNNFITGDLFYIADSPTFNQITNFYDFIPFINKNHIGLEGPMPEIVFHHYLKHTGIKIIPLIGNVNIRVVRTTEYLNLKGYLDKYESL